MMNQRDIIKIYANDGKEFKGTNYEELVKQRNDYEAELERKRLEREERLRKLQEEKQKKEEAKTKAMKWITDCVDLVNQAIEKYKQETGEMPNVKFINENGKLKVKDNTYSISNFGHTYGTWIDSYNYFTDLINELFS